MSGIVTLGRASVDQVAGSIATPMAATIGATIPPHRIFDVALAASAPAGTPVQRRKANTTVNPPATNQTPPADSTSPLTHTTFSDPIAGHEITTWTTAVNFAIGDTAHTLTLGCC